MKPDTLQRPVMRSWEWLSGILAAGVALIGPVCGCGEDDTGIACTTEAIAAALASAHSGDIVRIGECTVDGPFEIPSGVTLQGAGAGRTTIVVPVAVLVGVRLAPGQEHVTTLRGVAVELRGAIGVLARGAGSVLVEDVAFSSFAGVAAGLDGVTEATLRRVSVDGVVTADSSSASELAEVRARAVLYEGECPVPPANPDCGEGDSRALGCSGCGDLFEVCLCGEWQTVAPTHGIAGLGCDSLTLEDVTVSGLAESGVVVVDETTEGVAVEGAFTWRGGGSDEILGVGVFVGGSIATELEEVEVSRTWSGSRFSASVATEITTLEGRAPTITTRALAVRDNDRYGLVMIEASGHHDDLVAERNGDAAVWLATVDGVEIVGADLFENEFAGVFVADSMNVLIRDTRVEGTALTTRSVGGFGAVEVGDGIQLGNSRIGIALERVGLRNNARTGLLIDLGGTDGSEIHYTDVTVEGSGEQYGAVAGDLVDDVMVPAALGDWVDDGIERLGDTGANDITAEGLELGFAARGAPVGEDDFDPTGILTPCD